MAVFCWAARFCATASGLAPAHSGRRVAHAGPAVRSEGTSAQTSEVGYRLPKRYTASDRIQNFATASSRELIASLRNDHVLLRNVMAPQAGPVEAIDETDGLRVHFASGDIVHLRLAETPPSCAATPRAPVCAVPSACAMSACCDPENHRFGLSPWQRLARTDYVQMQGLTLIWDQLMCFQLRYSEEKGWI